MAKFILLRDACADRQRKAPDTTAPDPQIEIADLTAADLRDADRDPTVAAVARSMPTRLIEPEPLDDIRPDEAVPGWGLAAIGADRKVASGAGIRVAVLDTGVDAEHAAFSGVSFQHRDFAGSGIDDAHGHGTHVTGTILGRAVDGTEIGVAPGVTDALIGKVLTDDGHGTTAMLLRGLVWAGRAQAHVIAMSLAFDMTALSQALVSDEDFPQVLANAVALESHLANLQCLTALIGMLQSVLMPHGGPVIVAAAGNDSRRTVSPEYEVSSPAPALAAGIVSVGALTSGDTGLEPASFSNTGPTLAGPGGGVVSAALGGGCRALNGTSMACAHAAGAAALWWDLLGQAGQVAAGDVTRQMMQRASRSDGLRHLSSLDIGMGLVRAPT